MMEMNWFFQEDFAVYLRTFSMLIAFVLLVVFGGKESWMLADIASVAGVGAIFAAFPSALLSFQVDGKLDASHFLLVRLLGFVLLCSTLVWWFTRETRDATVSVTLMLSRVMSCSVMLLCQAYSHWGTTKGKKVVHWNDQFVWFGMFGTGLWLAGHLVHLLRNSDYSTYSQYNIRLNNHLRIDAWFLLLTSVIFLAFPDYVLSTVAPSVKTPNCVHLHLTRSIGAQAFASAVISLQAPGFLHERDKRAIFLGRIIEFLVVPIPLLWNIVLTKKIALDSLSPAALVFIPILLNALIGYFLQGTTIYKVSARANRDEGVNQLRDDIYSNEGKDLGQKKTS